MAKIECTFWGVGQGLFSSGQVHLPNSKFVWVYDCGSENFSLVQKAIHRMKVDYQQEDIDLLVISHFDKDHINGIKELCNNYHIKKIMLPYYPLAERLILAYMLKINQNDDFFELFVNPINYFINSVNVSKETEFLLAPISDIYSNSDPNIDPPQGDDELLLYEIQPLSSEFSSISNKVRWLNPKQYFTCQNEIEFFFYNVPIHYLKKYPTNFSVFKKYIDNIIAVKPLDIISIRKVYEKYFIRQNKKGENNSKDANVISLFLYVSPLSSIYSNIELRIGQVKSVTYSRYLYMYDFGYQHKKGILYTGDGSLKTKKLLNSFQNSMGDRLNNIAYLQVMHHGAEGNWRKGLGSLFSPVASIFSADENGKYNHPHDKVVKDFLPYNPILVNQFRDLILLIS